MLYFVIFSSEQGCGFLTLQLLPIFPVPHKVSSFFQTHVPNKLRASSEAVMNKTQTVSKQPQTRHETQSEIVPNKFQPKQFQICLRQASKQFHTVAPRFKNMVPTEGSPLKGPYIAYTAYIAL